MSWSSITPMALEGDPRGSARLLPAAHTPLRRIRTEKHGISRASRSISASSARTVRLAPATRSNNVGVPLPARRPKRAPSNRRVASARDSRSTASPAGSACGSGNATAASVPRAARGTPSACASRSRRQLEPVACHRAAVACVDARGFGECPMRPHGQRRDLAKVDPGGDRMSLGGRSRSSGRRAPRHRRRRAFEQRAVVGQETGTGRGGEVREEGRLAALLWTGEQHDAYPRPR